MKKLCVAIVASIVLQPAILPASIITSQPYSGITLIHQTQTSPRPENINVVEIDLTNPNIHFELSPATPPATNTFSSETTAQTTLNYMSQVNAQLAVNVNFFDFPAQPNGGTNLTGFAASLGNVYSAFESAPTLSYAIIPNSPVLNIDASNNAVFAQRGATATSLVVGSTPLAAYNSLSGSAQIITNGIESLPNVPTKPNTNPPLHWYTDQIAARTAVGLSQDSKTLFLFTVDAAGGSQGMSVDEETNFLLANYSVYNAINLDGGGSTTLAMQDPFTSIDSVINGISPSGARAVGSSLAVFAAPASSVPEPASVAVLLIAPIALVRRRKSASTQV